MEGSHLRLRRWARLDGLRGEFGDLRREPRSARLTIVITVPGTGIALFAALDGAMGGFVTAFQTGITALSAAPPPMPAGTRADER